MCLALTPTGGWVHYPVLASALLARLDFSSPLVLLFFFSDIAKDLQEVAAKFGYNYLELQVDFAIDLFPFYPPLVKVIRPRLKVSPSR